MAGLFFGGPFFGGGFFGRLPGHGKKPVVLDRPSLDEMLREIVRSRYPEETRTERKKKKALVKKISVELPKLPDTSRAMVEAEIRSVWERVSNGLPANTLQVAAISDAAKRLSEDEAFFMVMA